VLRASAHGPADQSAMPFKVIQRELAVCHHVPPDVLHGTTPAEDASLIGLIGPQGAISASGLWSMMRRFDQWVLGCNEYLMRVHADDDGRVYYRPVAPDLVEAEADPDDPSRPLAIWERRRRTHPERDEVVWTMEVVDIRDPEAPVYAIYEIHDGKTRADWTAKFLDTDAGWTGKWPDAYRKADGAPVLPYVLYHKERLGDRLFDAYDGVEIVRGSITLAVMLSFWVHCVRDASWPQRWIANGRVAGLETVDSGTQAARLETPQDPATATMLEAIEAGNQIMVGQWEPGSDPKSLLESIEAYAARLAVDAGLSGSDSQRSSSSARSGYAISLTNEGKRQAQKRYYEQFRDGDQQLIALTAILLNRVTASAYPEEGYSVVYREIPLSPDELRERRANVLELLAAGLMAPEDAYRELNPGLTRTQARAELERIKAGLPAEVPPTPPLAP
jgi:hypothetical protein